MKKIICILILMIMMSFLSCSEKNIDNANMGKTSENKKELIVMSGAGLKPALDKINAIFAKKYDANVQAQYMCSAIILANLLLTKQVDIFFPGSEYFMDKAIKGGAVDVSSVYPAAYMIPAITTPKGNPKNIKTIEDLTKPEIKVGLGNFKTLAVGRLAKKMLAEQNLLERVKQNHVLDGTSATKLQLAVSLGSVDAAINFKSAILLFDELTECYDIPIEKLKYSIAPCGISTFTKNRELASEYMALVQSPEGQKVFIEQGYYLPIGADKIEKIR